MEEDLDRIRNERRAYKEENHKLMKKVIQIEEILKEKESEYEEKLKKINMKVLDFQKSHDTKGLEVKLNEKSSQIKQLILKIQQMEDDSCKTSKH